MFQKNERCPALPLKDSTNSLAKKSTCVNIEDEYDGEKIGMEIPKSDAKLSGNWNLLVICDNIQSIPIPVLISEEQIYAEIRNTSARGFWYRRVCRQQQKITERFANISMPSSSSTHFGASYDDYYGQWLSHTESSAAVRIRMKRRPRKDCRISFSTRASNLEDTVIKMKHQLAITFHERNLPYCPTNISCFGLNRHSVNILPSSSTKHRRGSNELLHGCDCVVFEFFDVVAPLIPGEYMAELYVLICAVNADSKQVEFVDSLTNLVCCVNGKKNSNGNVVEYWIPRNDTKRFDELYVIVNGRFQSLTEITVAPQSNSMSPSLVKDGIRTRRKLFLTNSKFENELKLRRKNGVKSLTQKKNSPTKISKDEKKKDHQVESASNGLIKKVPGKRGRKRKIVEPVIVDTEENVFSSGSKIPNSTNTNIINSNIINPRKSVRERSRASDSLSPLKLSSSSDCVYLSDDEDETVRKSSTSPFTKISTPSKNTQKNGRGSLSPLKIKCDNLVSHRLTRHERQERSPDKQEKSFFGSKLIGKWKDMRINSQSKREFYPSYGNSGIILVNETDDSCMAWRDSGGRLIPSHQLIEQIQHLSKKSSKGGYTNLRMELSNEHGFGDILDRGSLAIAMAKRRKLNRRLNDRCSANLLHSVERWRRGKAAGPAKRISPRTSKEESPATSSTSTASSSSITSPLSSKQKNILSGSMANGLEKASVKTKLHQGKRAEKLSYVDGVQKREFPDLFYDILPYVGPTYTPLQDPPLPNLIGVDTNQGWLVNMSEARLNEFLDVSPVEKAFFVIWNSFTMRRVNRTVGRVGLPSLLERFVNEFGDEIVKRNMMFNFISHCACLCKCGHISQTQMYDAIFRLEKFKH